MTFSDRGGQSRARMLTSIVAVALASAGSGCTNHPTSSSGSPSSASVLSTSAKPPAADGVCAAHYAQFVLAEDSTVRFAAGGGPRPVPYVPPHIGTYGPDTPITLCLVPVGSAEFDVIAITPDGNAHRQWRQNDATHIYPLG